MKKLVICDSGSWHAPVDQTYALLTAFICRMPCDLATWRAARDTCPNYWLKSAGIELLDGIKSPCFIVQNARLSFLTLRELLFLPRVKSGKDPVTERELRAVVAEVDWGRQRGMWDSIRK